MTLSRQIALASVSLVVAAGACLAFGYRTEASAPFETALTSLKRSFERPSRIPFPAHNPFTEAKYELGKRLFFDPRLSRSGTMACATCHNPSLNWTDGMARAVGHGHRVLSRKSPTLLNAAWAKTFFWDGRASSLEEQALGPIQSPEEMNMNLPELVGRLWSIREYVESFQRAFPEEGITADNVGRAIATFERTVVSDIAPFDRWIAGEEKALSESAKRGFFVFNTKAACVRCHNGWNFTNGSFADVGLPTDDLGAGPIQNSIDANHAFKAPTLRNVRRRAPYMHDGSLGTLREVIANYDQGGTVKRPTVTLWLKPLGLTAGEKDDLIAFLDSLTSEDEVVQAPPLPRGEWEEDTWRRLSSVR